MTWEELYPTVKTQAKFAVLRYEEPERRKDKIQELLCQSFEKYQRDLSAGREIKTQDYKCFVTQRAKEVDTRSICKKGYGGTSTTDAIGYYRRRPDSLTKVVEFDDWMTGSISNKQLVDSTMSFNIDFQSWLEKLTDLQRSILTYLQEGYKATKIAEMTNLAVSKVKQIISQIKDLCLSFFELDAEYA